MDTDRRSLHATPATSPDRARQGCIVGANGHHRQGTSVVEALTTDQRRRLLRGVEGGDARAFEILVEQFEDVAWSATRRSGLSQDDREAVVWTAFAGFWRAVRRGAVTDPDGIEGYLWTIARNESVRVYRSRTRDAGIDDSGQQRARVTRELLFEPAELPEVPATAADLDALDRDTLRATVAAALDRMSETCRDLLDLWSRMDETDASYATIAATLGRPIGSIGPTLKRCQAKLRTLLLGDGFAVDEWMEGIR